MVMSPWEVPPRISTVSSDPDRPAVSRSMPSSTVLSWYAFRSLDAAIADLITAATTGKVTLIRATIASARAFSPDIFVGDHVGYVAADLA